MESTQTTKTRLARTATALILSLGVLVSVATSEHPVDIYSGSQQTQVSLALGQESFIAEVFLFGDAQYDHVSIGFKIFSTEPDAEISSDHHNGTWLLTVLNQPGFDISETTITTGHSLQSPLWQFCGLDGLPADPDVSVDTPCIQCPDVGSCMVQMLVEREGNHTDEITFNVEASVQRWNPPPSEDGWFLLNLVTNFP